MLSVYEAVANAVGHAYAVQSAWNTVEVHAELVPEGVLDVRVTDTGSWKPEKPSQFRGRGLPLMKAFSDTATVTTSSTGTEVMLQWAIVPHPDGASGRASNVEDASAVG